jgi:hypothetical protein
MCGLKETRKMFSGGKGGHCPPILARLFSTDQKRGRGFEPPQIFGPATETYRQCAAKRHKTPQNADVKSESFRYLKATNYKKEAGQGQTNTPHPCIQD